MRDDKRIPSDILTRLDRLDWQAIEQDLWEFGYAKTSSLLTAQECAELIALYGDDTRFRTRIDMARYRFGVGAYKYFTQPLPPLVREGLEALDPEERLGPEYPDHLDHLDHLDDLYLPLVNRFFKSEYSYCYSCIEIGHDVIINFVQFKYY